MARKERASLSSRSGFYLKLRREPVDHQKYQVLCYNCNCGRGFYGGECPCRSRKLHQRLCNYLSVNPRLHDLDVAPYVDTLKSIWSLSGASLTEMERLASLNIGKKSMSQPALQ